VRSRLEGVAHDGKSARCPAHDDRRASLSIAEGEDYRVLLTCFAGCKTEDVVKAAGLTMRDLFPANTSDRGGSWTIVATYDYCDESGRLLFQKVRLEPKDFRVRRPNGNGGWIKNIEGVRRVPYRLPELLAAPRDEWEFLVEGEKDADNLVATLGFVATTSPFGGSKTRSEKKWSPEFNQFFTGRRVAIIPDNDETGKKFARHVAQELVGVAFCVKIVELPGLPEKGDVSDFLAAGGTREQLLALVEGTAVVVRDDLEEADSAVASCASPTAWDRAKPAPTFINEGTQEVDWIIPKLVARECVTIIAAPKGLGKTMVLHAAAIALAIGGEFCGSRLNKQRVLLIDRDNPTSDVRRRLRGWGGENAPDLDVLGRDDAPPLTDEAAWRGFPVERYGVVFLDSFDASTEGVKKTESGATGKALAPILDVARRGPAVVVLANTDKAGEVLRDSAIISDRVDVAYEVRDATDLQVDPKQEAWSDCLPESGDRAWVARSKRRRHRDDYRLAFTESKFRIGEEPDPFVLEVRLEEGGWSVRDVTAEIEAKHEEARGEAAEAVKQKLEAAVSALGKRVIEAHERGEPLTKAEAEAVLCEAKLTRSKARAVLEEGNSTHWRFAKGERRDGRRGLAPTILVPVEKPAPAAEFSTSPNPLESGFSDYRNSAALAGSGRQNFDEREAAVGAAAREHETPPPNPLKHSARDVEAELDALLGDEP
jgi:hypothetical protein